MSVVLILGSALDVQRGAYWKKLPEMQIVAIKNAWRVRDDWDYCIYPDRYDVDLRPPRPLADGKRTVTALDYTPYVNELGGVVYGGAEMAFIAGYWALRALRPKVIAYLGCDLTDPANKVDELHSVNAANGVREDFSHSAFEAKSARLMLLAAMAGCSVVNLSNAPKSRLVFPRIDFSGMPFARPCPIHYDHALEALKVESECNYYVPSGRYWEITPSINPEKLDQIDRLWLQAAGLPNDSRPRAA